MRPRTPRRPPRVRAHGAMRADRAARGGALRTGRPRAAAGRRLARSGQRAGAMTDEAARRARRRRRPGGARAGDELLAGFALRGAAASSCVTPGLFAGGQRLRRSSSWRGAFLRCRAWRAWRRPFFLGGARTGAAAGGLARRTSSRLASRALIRSGAWRWARGGRAARATICSPLALRSIRSSSASR